MAKRRTSSRRSSKCPEPINTFINLAAGLSMGLIAAHQEKKYHYKEKGKVNPYTATAIGFATGRIKSHRDILRTGAILNAMGSFDVEADDDYRSTTIPVDPVFRQIKETKTNNNRYAWRLNCEDGSAYGVIPDNYETRSEYNEALACAKNESNEEKVINTNDIAETVVKNEIFKFIKVSRLDNGANEYFLADGTNIKVGDIIHLPVAPEEVTGVVLTIEYFTREKAPQPPEETLRIV